MKSFISQVLQKLLKSEGNISEIVFVLPSKRAGAYLLNELSKLSSTNIFSPKIYSIEEFTETISGLKTVDNTITLFEFYNVYKEITPQKEQEDFETFLNWAQNLIHDFNEVDRYLIDHKKFFNYLSEIQDINHWYLQKERTQLIENYLSFWQKLPEYYEALKGQLLNQQKGYQGLIYRSAAENIANYTEENSTNFVFIGFNALNTSEQQILQYLLENKRAQVFWDIDASFINDSEHEASLFVRQYMEHWPFYKENEFPQEAHDYTNAKDIEVIGIPKNIGQAKYLGEILSNLDLDTLKNTAVVMGQEDLLLPVLNSLPPNIGELNVTMGFPLKNAPVTSLFEKLFQIHTNPGNDYYYKDVISIVNHPSINEILDPYASALIKKINTENIVYINVGKIKNHFPAELQPLLSSLFSDYKNDPKLALENLNTIVQKIKTHLKEKEDALGLEFLYQFHLLFNKLSNLNNYYPHIKTIKSLQSFYKEIMSTQSLDFQGKPFKGLQLMGMLESRALDFETVIITSVNEGILPAGKSSNSFIPYELKKSYDLPTYKEKDAVYTYHFYRLLQRAKKVYLLYNTESNGLNAGEKSRFLTQLEIEKQPLHTITNKIISAKVPSVKMELKEVKKTPEIIERLKALANSGFSPSALTTYMRNPLDFYYQYILGVREQDQVEETVAYNTLGTVVHDSLENFYKPFENKNITEFDIKNFIERIPEEVTKQFSNTYNKTALNKGKNLIIFEVAKRYLQNFLKTELERIKKGENFEILQIETNLKTKIEVEGLDFPIYIKGKVDRVESSNGVTRIIDYKTGKVFQTQIEVVDWDNITEDYDKYSKSFQVLAYTTMIHGQSNLKLPVEAGIISFKNLQSGFLKFTKKDKPGNTKNKQTEIDEDILKDFNVQLRKLIAEICNPNISFREKEIKAHGSY